MIASVIKNAARCTECNSIRGYRDNQGARALLACENCGVITSHEPDADAIVPFRGQGVDKSMSEKQKKHELNRRIRFLAHQVERPPTSEEFDEHTDSSATTVQRYYDSWGQAVYFALVKAGTY